MESVLEYVQDRAPAACGGSDFHFCTTAGEKEFTCFHASTLDLNLIFFATGSYVIWREGKQVLRLDRGKAIKGPVASHSLTDKKLSNESVTLKLSELWTPFKYLSPYTFIDGISS